MSSITKSAFWLTLISGISAVLNGIALLVSPVQVSFGIELKPEIKAPGAMILGVILIVASILMAKLKSRKVGGIVALVLGFLLSAFMSTGSEYITLLPLISGILVLTHKEKPVSG